MGMACNSHTLFFTHFHLLMLLLFIHGGQTCPSSIYFDCPDHAYGGRVLKYPFTTVSIPGCGYCTLKCDNNVTMIACKVNPDEESLQVLNISTAKQTMVLRSPKVAEWRNNPCRAHEFFSIKSSPWVSLIMGFKTFIKCPIPQHPPLSGQEYVYNCSVQENNTVYGPYGDSRPPNISSPNDCEVVQIPSIPPNTNTFTVRYEFSPQCQQCVQAGGRCSNSDPGICYNSNNGKKRLAIILSSVLAGCLLIILVLIIYRRKRKNKPGLSNLASRIISFNRATSDLEEGTVNGGVAVFYYKELEEATNNFDPTRELGEGGFGIVYHGKLRDGREVAVKRLYEKNYKRIEQFKNEIEILTGLHHKNLVTLYGCTSRHSRELLLVYEYIPNGTVADHLHGDHPKSQFITWSARMNIAIETAEALSYLHYKDIIHRDVKTNNILLDNNFSVKVADFGLSRLFPADVTHISTAPQGTPGYLDPEYHQCYHLTDKSDVYSFGVVLIELISSLPAVDIGRHRHEINLSNYAIIKIQGRAFNELVDPKLGFETDSKVTRMTTLVAELAFQCLQHERDLRPSMDEVLVTLKRIISLDYDALEAGEMEMRVESKEFMKPLPSSTDNIGFVKNAQRQSSLPEPVTEKWLSQSMKRPPSLKGDGGLRFLRISQEQPKSDSPTENDDVGLLRNAHPLPTSPASVMDNWSSQSSTPNTSS